MGQTLIPNVIDAKHFHFNPSVTTFTTAEIAAIDGAPASTAASILPYAYTATVAPQYDAQNYYIDGQVLAIDQRLSVGLFLTPDLEKGNLLFQLTGNFTVGCTGGFGNLCTPKFFFGRKATNNTVVSSKATPSNALDKYTILGTSDAVGDSSLTGEVLHRVSIKTELFTLAETAGFVYCFGLMLDNDSGFAQTLQLHGSLSIRKFSDTLDTFSPIR